ncbi:hypothetical protein [Croceibacterium ferulae]|uniref:hypothetical protein n=1 Tax=Croceibacterium ferulae TaxID=1854641 RepID=UPI000F869E99|nr:hypothetical protein [Croceibacterium ferulae]
MRPTEKSRIRTVNQHGKHRVVVEMQHWNEFKPMRGSVQRHPGGTELFTDDGYDVNLNRDGTYTVLQTDEVLTKV